jgi:hypothetical protein
MLRHVQQHLSLHVRSTDKEREALESIPYQPEPERAIACPTDWATWTSVLREQR